MLVEILTPDFSFEDERGSLNQLVHDGYKQVNVIFSKRGVFRGNHYHKDNTEAFYVISGRIKLELSKGDIVEKYSFSKGDMFQIPPYVNHSFYYEEDTWLVSMYSNGVEYENGEKDIWRDE